jgi:putative cardiolipin synthase
MPLPRDFQPNPSLAFRDSERTLLGQLFAAQLAEHPGQSGFHVVDTGQDAFFQWAMLADAAERAIDAQYYIWNNDTTGRLLAERMLRAAERGVQVRLLIDDLNVGDKDPHLLALDRHPNIQIRTYNPFKEDARSGLKKWLSFFADFRRLNRRMHNKTYVVDGSVAIVGGRNIGDEYFDASDRLNFRDRDLLAVGPVVQEVSANFDAFWNSRWAYPIDVVVPEPLAPETVAASHTALKSFVAGGPTLPYESPPRSLPVIHKRLDQLQATLIWATAELVYDRPGISEDPFKLANASQPVARRIFELMRHSKHDILIESAYFIPSDLLLDELGQLTAAGISIRALTNSLASNDVLLNHAGYARRRRDILRQGVALYELRPDAASCQALVKGDRLCGTSTLFGLHAKSAVFDHETVFVGSFNLNMRSTFLNSETALIVYSRELAQQIAATIEENLKPENSWRITLTDRGALQWTTRIDGVEIRFSQDPQTSFWQRFKSGFIALFPLEQYY